MEAVRNRPLWKKLLPFPEVTSLRNRDYRFWWLAALAGSMNQSTNQIAMSWLVLQLTDSDPRWVGAVIAASGVPAFLFTIPAGVIADKINKKVQLIVGQTIAFLSAGLFGVLVLLELATPQLALVFAFISGAAFTFGQPARQSLMPLLIPREDITNGVVLGSMAMNTSRLAGPFFAGLFIALIGLAAPFFFLAALLFGGLISISLIHMPKAPTGGPQRQREGAFRSLAGGAIFLWQHKPLLVLVMMMTFVGVFVQGPIQALVPIMVDQVWKTGSSGLSLIFMMQALAGIVGGVYLSRMGGMKNKGAFSAFGMVFFSIFLILFAMTPIFWLAVIIFFIRGLFASIFMNMEQSLLQTHTPPEIRGRVLSINGLAIAGFIPVGALLFSFLASQVGAPMAMAIGGLAPLALGILILLFARSYNRLS
jgi:MFS family permease